MEGKVVIEELEETCHNSKEVSDAQESFLSAGEDRKWKGEVATVQS